MNQIRTEAERLRDMGYSYNMITDALGVSKSTMSYWFKDRPFTPNHQVIERIKHGPIKNGQRRHNERVAEIANLKALGIQEIGELSERDLWMLGLGLYIGEGAKTVETVRVANSDPAVIATIITWLRTSCGLTTDNLRIRLHLYPDSNIESAVQHWQDVTGIPRTNFKNPQIDIRQNKKRAAAGKLPYGTAHIYVVAQGDPEKGARLYRKLQGWIAGALRQI